MKIGIKLFFVTFFYALICLPMQGFSAAVNHAEVIVNSTTTVISKKKNNHLKPLKKIKNWFKKWKAEQQTHDDTGDDIGAWTWVSMGLILACVIFPPFAFAAIITAAIALRKNRKDENLGDLDRTLALTALILGIVISVVLLAVVGLFFWGYFFI
jgi:hypothetical protein